MWSLVKVSKAAALLAFVLPWMTVSCSNQKLLTATGWNLVTGKVSVTNPMTGATQVQSGSGSMMLALALVAIVVGLVVSIRASRNAAPLVIGTSVASLISIWLATRGMSSEAIAREASKRSSGQFDAAMMAMIRVDWQIGYWIAVLALIISGMLACMAMSGRSLTFTAPSPSAGSVD